jgi:NADH-quinone oxidoreductase subunit N
LAYSITTLVAFGIITLLSTREKDAEKMESYRGLFWRHPILAAVLTVALLSLAGIPLTGGFIGKFAVLTSGVQQGLWGPVIVLVLTSVVGIYYYLRIITTLFTEGPTVATKEKVLHPFFYNAMYAALIVLTVVLLGIGIYPSGVMDGIRYFLAIG